MTNKWGEVNLYVQTHPLVSFINILFSYDDAVGEWLEAMADLPMLFTATGNTYYINILIS